MQQFHCRTIDSTISADNHYGWDGHHSLVDPYLIGDFNLFDSDDYDARFSNSQTFSTEFYTNFINGNAKVNNSITDKKLFTTISNDLNNYQKPALQEDGQQQIVPNFEKAIETQISENQEMKLIKSQPKQNDYDNNQSEMNEGRGQKSILANNDDQENENLLNQIISKQKSLLFPQKLWNLANSSSFPAINWSKNGLEIQINIDKLTPFLRHITRTHKFESFLRQLHMYGFRKTTNFNLKKRKFDRNIVCYFREGFTRDVHDFKEIDKIFRFK